MAPEGLGKKEPWFPAGLMGGIMALTPYFIGNLFLGGGPFGPPFFLEEGRDFNQWFLLVFSVRYPLSVAVKGLCCSHPVNPVNPVYIGFYREANFR